MAPSTQNQAKSGLLFFYQRVLGIELGFIEAARVKQPDRIPFWYSRSEVELLQAELFGVHRLMFLLMYGAGLRHKECRRLRIKNVSFDDMHVVVRDGKGAKDRITCLPEKAIPLLKEQIELAKRLHEKDVDEGYPAVYMPLRVHEA